MRTYMIVRIWSFLILIVFIFLAILFNINKCDFLSNISIGVFTGSALTYIGSIISYKEERRGALISYLGALQTYRMKFESLKYSFFYDKKKIKIDVQTLNEYFYDMHYNSYVKLQHLNFNHKIPKRLNETFELVSDIHYTLLYINKNNSDITYYDIVKIDENINKAIDIAQNLAIEIHCLDKK